jgi:hypothetical protein
VATTTGLSTAQVQSLIQQKLIALRDALADITELHTWTSGLATSDMETAAGLSAADAQTYLSACADAAAVAGIYSTGLPPGSYPQPASAYVYAATSAQVIGPQ